MEHALKPLREVHSPEYDIQRLGKYTFIELSSFKDSIEAELTALVDDLDRQHISMETSLITIDGFPRGDIDVVDIRMKRIKIIQLKNDLELILNELTTHLSQELSKNKQVENQVPFLQVDDVLSDGIFNELLLKNDKIIELNELNALNYLNLQNIGSNIKNNKFINLTIKRDRKILKIKNIEHKGSLGLKLTPL